MEKTSFDLALLRLKTALGVSDDQDVASLLGLTKAAFSARKKRGAFPEDKLRALASRSPELGLDVCYVLTGEYLSAAQAKTEVRRRLGLQTAVSVELSDDEVELIKLYRAAPLAIRLAAVAALASTGAQAGGSGGKYAGATVGAVHEKAPKKMTIKQEFNKKDK